MSARPQNGSTQTLIRIEQGNVFRKGKRVLQDIDWELRADQHWAVLGPNGAGKSTFLKLILGELHLAFGGAIRRFDLTSANTVWDLKRKIGYISPNFQACYREALTGREVVASGFFSTVGLIDQPTARQRQKVRQLLARFGFRSLGGKHLLEMSYGEVRALLTLRALVNEPEILLLDEPFDGLDAATKKTFARTLDHIASHGTRLVVVTHHANDLPSCISHGLLLENGRMVFQGEMARVRSHPVMRHWFKGQSLAQ